MTKRRPSGDGMIRLRKKDQWEGRIVVGHKDNGDPIFRYVYAKSQNELLQKLHQKMNQYQDTELTEDSSMTLGEWLDKWLNEFLPGTIRPSTLDGYRRNMDNYVKPILGDKKIAFITTNDIQKMYAKLKKEGRIKCHPEYGHELSDSSVVKIHTTLHSALDMAVREHLIPKNPTNGTKVPKKKHKELRVLNDAELDTLMKVIEDDEVWGDFFYLELTTGLRQGEICGLKWTDFDETEGKLHINRTIRLQKGGGIYEGETKTGKGMRCIILPSGTVELLIKRKRSQTAEWIFPDTSNPAEPLHPPAAYRKMKLILEKAGLPNIRFHDLRHTFATHALTSGVDAKTLSGILGHTKASFTLDTYTHITSDMQKRASNIVGSFIEDIFGKELKPWEDEKTAKEA